MAQSLSIDDDLPPRAIDTIDAGPESQAVLDELIAKATAKYATKHYSTAAEYYSRATEMQANLNGEMNTRNADLLYLYGRCLYHVAIQNSDVLGNKVAGEDSSRNARKMSSDEQLLPISIDSLIQPDNTNAENSPLKEISSITASEGGNVKARNFKTAEIDNPYFTITGDENWDDSEDELAGDGHIEKDEANEAEDDFSNAFEVLDIARVLLEKRISEFSGSLQLQGQKEHILIAEKDRLEYGRLREKLADTRDLQAEIGLEAERFQDAAIDLQASLDIKKELYPVESSVIAEAHYKLSLALEFSSTAPATDEAQSLSGVELRNEAAWHMESAIRSCQERIKIEEKILESGNPDMTQDNAPQTPQHKRLKVTPESVDEVKDMVCDMEQRLKELREPPLSIQNATSLDAGGSSNGLLESIMHASPELQKVRLQEALEKANDLSNLVKKKKKEGDQGEKRKADVSVPEDAQVKKVRNS